MSNADQKIGLMDGAYFVGRKDILDWINTTCMLSYTKVEHTASGAVACQLLDSMYPGVVPMQKVDWSAKNDFDFIKNYKVLQACFNKLKIDKHVEVDRLIRAKYQDNLEFMQWFKRFHELNSNDSGDYDPIGQRSKGKGGDAVTKASGVKPDAKALLAAASGTHKRKQARNGAPAPGSSNRVNAAAGRVNDTRHPAAAEQKENQHVNEAAPKQATKTRTTGSRRPAGNTTASNEKVKELETMNAELRLTVDGLERERDFYFGKLRDIEILLQSNEETAEGTTSEQSEVVQRIFKILYATEDDFEAADADAVGAEVAPGTDSPVVAPEEFSAPVALAAQ